MTVQVGALREYRRKKSNERQAQRLKQAERVEREQVNSHLRSALKVVGGSDIKRRQPLDISELSLERQVQLLEQYAERLTDEIEDFKEQWGDTGKRGLTWLRSERGAVLVSLAKVKIEQLKEGYTPGRRNHE